MLFRSLRSMHFTTGVLPLLLIVGLLILAWINRRKRPILAGIAFYFSYGLIWPAIKHLIDTLDVDALIRLILLGVMGGLVPLAGIIYVFRQWRRNKAQLKRLGYQRVMEKFEEQRE